MNALNSDHALARSRPLAPRLAAITVTLLAGCTGAIGGAPVGEPATPSLSPTGANTARTNDLVPSTPGARSDIPGNAVPDTTIPERPPDVDARKPVTCTATGDGAGPKRLWRLSEAQFRSSLAYLFAGRPASATRPPALPSGLGSPFETASEAYRFSNFSAAYNLVDAELRRSLDLAADASARLVAQLRKDPASCLGPGAAKKPFEECIGTLIEDKGAILFRRPLAPDEVMTYRRLAMSQLAVLGEDDAASATFQVLLGSPYFLYRTELGAGAGDASGLVRLLPFELAAALSLTFADAPPDQELWRAAQTGALATPEQVRAQVERLMGVLPERAPVVRFFRELFRYHRARAVFKDPKLFAFHDPEDLSEETELFVQDTLASNGRGELLSALLLGTTGFARAGTAPSYGLTGIKDTKPAKVTFPAGQRAGILTQPSFLVTHSAADHNEPVRRGRFISESLLCREVPELAVDQIPPLPELGPTATMRDKLKPHSARPDCAACHRLMDPLGLGLEGYDHLGRFRTTESGRAVDASGVMSDSGNQDGPFDGAAQLAAKLAGSTVVEECFVRHAFRYWMGRNEGPGDACTLAAAQNAFRKNKGDFVELMVAIATSKSFQYRR